jgi:hypothetical protein
VEFKTVREEDGESPCKTGGDERALGGALTVAEEDGGTPGAPVVNAGASNLSRCARGLRN